MGLERRLEKIRFVVQEIDLAAHVARCCAADQELARIWARRALIRCADLIDHTEQIRRDLLAQGADYTALKTTRVAYDSLFGSDFGIVRDRIAAHVQDITFLTRIDVWNSIDAERVGVFVEGAIDIHDRCLGGMNLSGFSPYAPFPEKNDTALCAAIGRFASRRPNGPAIGVDSFAAARPNTGVLLNTTPVHERAQMIVALRRWIGVVLPFALDAQLGVNLRRLAIAELVTDLVALGDCLVSRIGAGAKQQMEGLDALVEPGGAGAETFKQWLSGTGVRNLIDDLRDTRNTVGAHLDASDATSLAGLEARLDGLDRDRLVRIYRRLSELFTDVCRAQHYLHSYLLDGKELKDVIQISGAGEYRTYDGSAAVAVKRDPRRLDPDDENGIGRAIDEWCGTQDVMLGNALAFTSSAGRTLERFQVGSRSFHLRPFHGPFTEQICRADTHRFGALMRMAERLGRQDPVPLVESLMRGLEPRPKQVSEHALVADALSRIPLRADESDRVTPFLMELLAEDLVVAHPALLALYQQRDTMDFGRTHPVSGELLGLVAHRSVADRLIATAALIGRVWSGAAASSSAVLAEAELLRSETIALTFHHGKAEPFERVARGNAVGLLVWAAELLEDDDPNCERLFRCAVAPTIAYPVDRRLREQAKLYRARAHAQLGEEERAREIGTEILGSLDYSRPKVCVGILETLASYGIDPSGWATSMREACVLDDDDRRRLDRLQT